MSQAYFSTDRRRLIGSDAETGKICHKTCASSTIVFFDIFFRFS